jgi:hypothetical protein
MAVVLNAYLLPHLGGDNCIVAGLLDCLYELCSVAPRCAHHERHPPLHVILRIACDESVARYLESGKRLFGKSKKMAWKRLKDQAHRPISETPKQRKYDIKFSH